MQQRYNLGLALVLLAVGLVWACNQQLPTAPTAPTAISSATSNASPVGTASAKGNGPKNCEDDDPRPSCNGSGGAGQPAELDLAVDMDTTGLAVMVKENPETLNVDNGNFSGSIKMQFASPEPCEGFAATKGGVEPDEDDEIPLLKKELTDGEVTAGFFTMQIDKNSLPGSSEGHLLLVERDGTVFDETVGITRIQFGSPFEQVDPVTVIKLGSDPDVFQFTGPVVVWAHGVGGGGGVKSNRIIVCKGSNEVVATVELTP